MQESKLLLLVFLFSLVFLFTFPVNASEQVQNSTVVTKIETYSEATAVSLSTKISPSISIIITPDTIDFGKLSAGMSSEVHKLTIFNKGSSKTYVTSEVIDVAKDLYVEGLEINNASWVSYGKEISKDDYVESGVQLNVPEEFIGIGSMEGKLIFWAEMKENNAPVLENIEDISVNSSDIVKIILHASDADNDKLTYSTTAEFGTLYGNVFEWNTTGIEAGKYEISFLVSDGYSTDSETIMITIKKEANDVFPVVNFTTNVTNGKIPLTVMFTDQSLNATSWKWNFGDGTSSTDRNVVHTYTEAGCYTVSLEAGNNYGNDTEKKIDYIIAYPRIIISLISPSSSYITDQTGASRLFEITTDEIANITWILDDVIVQTNYSSMNASYYCSSAANGLYNLTIFAENENGTAQKEWIWNVTSVSSSDSASSSSSSGRYVSGGGYFGEDYDNILDKVSKSQNVLAKKVTTFSFNSDDNPIKSISFIALKNSGVVSTTIEILKGISTLVSEAPPGEVYKYMNIWVGDTGFATADNIENAVISFKVEKSWVSDNDIQSSLISLYRYNDNKWKELETQKVKEDERYLYFESETPGFSPFVITGIKKESSSGTAVVPLRSTAEDEIPSSNDSDTIDLVPTNASSSSISIWILVFCLFLILAGTGIYIGERKGFLSFRKNKYENVIFKDTLSCEISPDGFTSYYFDAEENPVEYIRLKTKDCSDIVEVKVEILRNRSLLVKSDPPGIVYKHLNIWIVAEGVDPLTLDAPLIGFKVKRPWIEENEIEISSINLFRFADDMWQNLPTEMVEETDEHFIFESDTPGFSSFAICSV
ncbi:PDK repeat-containing protein [Methanolobus tindarius DSM 2278]|uniref:PDK repeat-containing protein n=1 Tax=Methanolobus tindarius DSM 2278 TaxID=1090322 RepID=W9DTD3_METTI|nr:PGF-pre-PGF domain-containing protein [Methanolobus tindarius]ETA66952.1 PDK repeat-containing protein [Methanolobus tindarius DSM 2278]